MSADSSVFYAVADPTRRAILDLLRDRMQSAESTRTVLHMLDRLAARFVDLTQSAFSQHLAVLRRAGLVTVEKRGRLRVYSLQARPLEEIADWVTAYDAFWSEKLDHLRNYLDSHGAAPPSGSPPTPQTHGRSKK